MPLLILRAPVTPLLTLVKFTLVCWVVLLPSAAKAWVIQAEAGTAPVSLPNDMVACETAKAGWTVTAAGRAVQPPADALPGQTTQLRTASSSLSCDTESKNVQLLAVGPLPEVDVKSVILSLDTSQLSFTGTGLTGMRVAMGKVVETCLNISVEGKRERCTLPTPPVLRLRAGLRFRWAPVGGVFSKESVTATRSGATLVPGELELVPTQILLRRAVQAERSFDFSSGTGELELTFPDAVASVECDGAQCELDGNRIRIRSVPASTTKITLRLQLRPRFFLRKGEALETQIRREFEVIRCDLRLISGSPLRDVEEIRLLARLPLSCGSEAERLSWLVNGEEATIERIETQDGEVFVLLRSQRLVGGKVTILALRPQDQSVVALTAETTLAPFPVHTSLSLDEFGQIDFIPKNQSASVATSATPDGKLVPIELPGAYTVEETPTGPRIRGVYQSGGYTSLKLGYRLQSVPAAFRDTDFAVITDPAQRPIREANLPISLSTAKGEGKPVFELKCELEVGKLGTIALGTPTHIPFGLRDTCRLLIHRSRIPDNAGEQLIEIEAGVTTAGETERGEARLSEKLLLRHGKQTDVIWLHGMKQQFDRLHVRIHHVVEEARYLLGHGSRYRLTTAQWTVVAEDAFLKFYATATIPSGLYRFSNDREDLGTGALALNFGVLTRLTLLNDKGQESLVGLEGGMMSMGLASEKDRQLAVVGGLGVGVPLGNINQPTQASLNIHAWVAYTLGEHRGQLVAGDGSTSSLKLNPWALIFGPSITIGSLAAFL